MKIKLEDGAIVLTPETLSSFAKSRVRAGSVSFKPSVSPYGDEAAPRDFSYETVLRGEKFIVRGRPDGIFTFSGETAVWMTRSVKKVTSSVTPYSDPAFLARCYVVAHLVCRELDIPRVTLKVTVSGENGEKNFDIFIDAETAKAACDDLLSRAAFFAIVEKNFDIRGKSDIKKMPFPYKTIREGQEDFIKEAYRAIKRKSRLLVSAPTGIGKTVSALFPAVKAIGDGAIEKVFYLTAKTVTGRAAAKAVEVMRNFAPDIRAVMISAKERICPSNDKKNEFFVERCSPDCPRLSWSEHGDYTTRRNAALEELLGSGGIYGKAEIYEAAEKHSVCPYELSLDLSEYCQVVICDYNYATDPRVRFRRYFVEGEIKYAFLVDEAHNLPDRTRETFSATVSNIDVAKLARTAKDSASPDADLIAACGKMTEALDAVAAKCSENAEVVGNERAGYIVDDRVPEKLVKAVAAFSRAAAKAKRDEDAAVSALADEASGAASDFITASELFDEHFTFFAEMNGDSLSASVICLDPSAILDAVFSGAVSTILFSATLSPTDYFLDVTGCRGAATLELESPYSPENLSVTVVDGISTKFLSRGDTAYEVAEAIVAATSAKPGHYIVYFPSYKYLDTVFSAFKTIAPKGFSALVQKPSMSLDARRRFLSFFEKNEGDTLVGFCVLGGIFSEGIDLPDDRLIGAILVGIGLPSLSSKLNILKEYYDRTREGGFEFAYLYPALIKISQAAGRVIRDEGDRGVVVLIDDRYRDPSIMKLLPSHWKNVRVVGDARSLSANLKKFWDTNNGSSN